MATLDILIPHYNDPEALALSLRSIARQSWPGEKRIVIADDGSRPDLRKAVEAIAEHSEMRIDPIFNQVNRGRPYTRNVLLDSIESPYVAWLDAGDEWYPDKLDRQFDHVTLVESAHMNRPFWVTCNYDWAWAGRKKKKNTQRTDQDQMKGLLIGSTLRAYLWTLLGPAQSFKDVGWFDERLPRLQDLDYFVRFLTHGGVIKNVRHDGALCVYHKSDIGRNADEIRACNAHIFDKHRVLFNRYGESFRAMRLYNMEMLSARFAQNNKSAKLTRQYMWRALKARPKAFLAHTLKNGLKA
ncbi:glycosyltransferase family 2 protein [Sinorhizobium numidicum]|uniref:Glycosyltransferase family 2 protein n=1 Tax=Sinorhizobium numidicum TaxID=680248 RepID=A0ABY8CV05_9HYPH|nr:glycosyltransferase family 2 protein [Sinorhizobium numidicum]WEX75089.1 glycosyltransferase family 2 protein [Sinorhizobium numidicum]WEX81083.1 glycosyltransferase family 2 protein [Sinorhizobium numidicum]